MSMVEIIVLGAAVAMDAFAVTISNAFCYRGASRARLFVLPIAFGVFQGLMPLLGFFLGGIIGNITIFSSTCFINSTGQREPAMMPVRREVRSNMLNIG